MKLITVDEEKKRFLLKNKNSSYAFQVSKSGQLVNLHWGGRIDRIDDLPTAEDITVYRHRPASRRIMNNLEYPGWGGAMFTEPALKINGPGGVRSLFLVYKSYSIKQAEEYETLTITLNDTLLTLEVNLFYRIYRNAEVIDRWSEVTNHTRETINIENIMSACWQLPRRNTDYRLTHLAGRWAKEGQIEQIPVTQTKTVLESRTGISGHLAMPIFALDHGNADEDLGLVWFGTLQWSGNWKIAVERDGYEQVSVCGGINDFDCNIPLAPDCKFTSPVFTGGYTAGGFGEASRILHHYQRLYIEPENMRNQVMPLIYNSFAALGVGSDMNVDNAIAAARLAAQIGTELFVFDAGWQKALGDWIPDSSKFPNGLEPVIKQVREIGMTFGIWVEIEAVDMDSDLYKEHPEWIMAFSERPLDQYVRDGSKPERLPLNFARNDVMEYMYNAMFKLLSENEIDYLKLDMNRYFTNPGWDDVPESEQRMLWIKYVDNLYELFQRLRQDFPNLLMENCASGNGRSDLGMSRMFGRINRSDNQDTLDILRLHEGYSWLHLPKSAGGGCHISDYTTLINKRQIPLQFQAFAGMLGSLAIGKNLPACTQEQLDELKKYGDLYKKLRHVIHLGNLYRLASHYDHPYAMFEYASEDKKEAVLIALGHSIQFADKIPAIQLRGLDPDTMYEIEIHGNNPDLEGFTASVTEYPPTSGRGLMEIGIRIELLGDYDSKILYIKEQK